MAKYIVNALSFSMFNHLVNRRISLTWREIGEKEFCETIKDAFSYIGHHATADVISSICGFAIGVVRDPLRVYPGDKLYLVQILKRLPEGKVLSKEEVLMMLGLGEVRLYEISVGGLDEES